MQVVENLLVVHNIDEQTSQAYDLKLGSADYNEALRVELCTVDSERACKGKYIADFIGKDEKKTSDQGYNMVDLMNS